MYKIIHNSRIIDVVQNPRFLRFLPSGHVAITDKSSAHGIAGSDSKTIYSFGTVKRPNAKIVTIVEISLDEFNRLQNLLNSEQEISVDTNALARAKEETIKNLSEICKNTITAGFSIKLSDGELHRFKLTPEDQLNLLNLENQLNSGAKTFVYHAAGEDCKAYLREDIIKIVKAYRKYQLYHTTYFNVAKQYINSLTDTDSIKSFVYGTTITGLMKDPTIRKILREGGRVQ